MAFNFDELPVIDQTETNQIAKVSSFNFDQLPIQDTETEVDTKEKKPLSGVGSKIEAVADIAFPAVGGAVGGILGSLPGAVVGASAGKGIQEGLEVLLGKEKTLFPNTVKSFLTDDTVAGNIVKEGALAYVGGKALPLLGKGARAVGKAINPKQFAMTKTLINSELGKKGTKAFSRLGDYFQGVIDKVPENAKKDIIRNISLSGEKQGIKPSVTKRVLERGPKNILSESNLATDSIDIKTAINASQAFDDAIQVVSKEFDSKVVPVLKGSEDLIDITDIVKKYSDDLSEIVNIKQVGKKSKLIGKPGVEDKAATQLSRFSDNIQKLTSNPTPMNLHKTKQDINKILKAKVFKDNPSASRVLQNMHKGLRKKLDDAIPEYKRITDDFRDVFTLQDDFGSKTIDDRIESLATEYFNPQKEVLRSKIDLLMERSPRAKESLNKLFDERAAKDFISIIKRDPKYVGVQGIGFRLPGTGTSKRKFGESLIRKSEKGFKSTSQRGISGGIPPLAGGLLRTIEEE